MIYISFESNMTLPISNQ